MATIDPRQIPVSELENKNVDRTVNPEVMLRGMMARTSGGSWVYVSVTSASGSLIVNI